MAGLAALDRKLDHRQVEHQAEGIEIGRHIAGKADPADRRRQDVARQHEQRMQRCDRAQEKQHELGAPSLPGDNDGHADDRDRGDRRADRVQGRAEVGADVPVRRGLQRLVAAGPDRMPEPQRQRHHLRRDCQRHQQEDPAQPPRAPREMLHIGIAYRKRRRHQADGDHGDLQRRAELTARKRKDQRGCDQENQGVICDRQIRAPGGLAHPYSRLSALQERALYRRSIGRGLPAVDFRGGRELACGQARRPRRGQREARHRSENVTALQGERAGRDGREAFARGLSGQQAKDHGDQTAGKAQRQQHSSTRKRSPKTAPKSRLEIASCTIRSTPACPDFRPHTFKKALTGTGCRYCGSALLVDTSHRPRLSSPGLTGGIR